MRVYKCDACGEVIKEPHKVGMKEFCFEVSNCDTRQVFLPVKRKKKIHLCELCFKCLCDKIGERNAKKCYHNTCNQICDYNFHGLCRVKEQNGACPLLQIDNAVKSGKLVATNDVLKRDNQEYEVVIADDNIFVVCPIMYEAEEESNVVKYDKAEIYANQLSLNTLEELGFEKCT